MARYTVYADLNCPFSYALHEQLISFGLMDQVDWRLIEHAPDLDMYNSSAESQAELASDVFIVRTLASHIELALPKKRSDSRFASLCVIHAEAIDKTKAANLRHLLYQALWIDGKDISDVSVIFECLVAADLPAEVDIESDEENTLSFWQKSWEKGEYNRRIPVLEAMDGRISLGLPGTEDLLAFFKGEEISAQALPGESHVQIEQQTIAIYSDHGIESIWPLISSLRTEYNILLPANLNELKTLLKEDPPQLLLLSTEDQWPQMLSLCKEITQHKEDSPLPIALVSHEADDHIELEAYSAGASDFLVLTRSPVILLSRIQILMQLKQSQDLLARSARIDGLTQVNNRREFERSIETEWRRVKRAKRKIALIMLDIDHFKAFNDFYGHLAGDGCLRTIAKAISSSIQRAHDLVCRYGGEEFAIILPDTDLRGAEKLAHKMNQAVKELNIEHEKSTTQGIVTISAGVACLSPFHEGSPHDLISQADQALYQAKNAGRDRVISQASE